MRASDNPLGSRRTALPPPHGSVKGEIDAQKLDCAPFDETRFKEALAQLRNFTTKDPEEFVPALHERCAGGGVAVAIVPPLAGVRAYGATRWLHSTKALIQLSLRGKTDDHLWFTFFHEAGHVLKHGKRAVFMEDGECGNLEKERSAGNGLRESREH